MVGPTLDVALDAALRWIDDLATTAGHDMLPTAARKMEIERAEYVAEPSLDEAADVAICLAAACAHHDWGLDALAATIRIQYVGQHRFTTGLASQSPLHDHLAEALDLLDHARKLAEYAQTLGRSRASFVGHPNLVEAAEIMVCVAASVRCHGWDLVTFARAVEAKNARNATRRWNQMVDGTFQHDRAEVSA